MDRWKYSLKSVRKENGFENLKTRFQDCNLSGEQENKPDGMIEKKQPFNRERKRSAKKAVRLCGKMERKEADKDTRKQDNKTKVRCITINQYYNEERNLVCGFLHPKGWGRQNNVHRLGGKLPVLPERCASQGSIIIVPLARIRQVFFGNDLSSPTYLKGKLDRECSMSVQP